MRVTLSYLVEPSPGRHGWPATGGVRYQSFGLRFALKRPEERLSTFLARINQLAREMPDGESDKIGETTSGPSVVRDGRRVRSIPTGGTVARLIGLK